MNPKWCDTNRETSMSSIFSPPALWFLIQLHLHESTPSIMSTVHEYILWLCWGLLTLCHKDLKNPVHDMLFPTVEVMEKHLSSISFAAGLLEVLLSPLPPMIDWIKSLPTQSRGLWGVYLILLGKPKCRPRIYIGSGTGTTKQAWLQGSRITPTEHACLAMSERL